MRNVTALVILTTIVIAVSGINRASVSGAEVHSELVDQGTEGVRIPQTNLPSGDEMPSTAPVSVFPWAIRLLFLVFFLDGLRMWVQLAIGSVCYKKKHAENPLYMPKVSVVIPAWNEQTGIKRTVQSIVENGYPNYEVVVVDDGSTDRTSEVVDELQLLYPGVVRLVSQENAGKARAMNRGVSCASGEIIICVDADTFLHPTAIRNIVKYYEDPKVAGVVGRVLIGNTRTWLGKLQYFEYMVGFHLKRTQHVFNTIYILSGALCSYRKAVFDQIEGYTEYSKTEDMDLSLQMRQKNLKLVYAFDAECSTEGASDLRGLMNQRVRWRYGGLACLFHHRNLFFNPHIDFGLSFYELPTSVYGIFQIIVYPLILLIAYGAPLITGEYIYLVLVYASILVNFTIIFLTTRPDRKMLKYFPLLTIMMQVVMLIEHIAALKALYRHLFKLELKWTAWNRQGVIMDRSMQSQRRAGQA